MDRIEAKKRQIDALLTRLHADLLPQGFLVGHVMTPAPDCITEATSVLDLVRSMHSRGTRHTLVTDDEGRLTGVISDRDVIRCFGPAAYPEAATLETIRARDIMSTDLITASPELPLVDAAGMLLDFGISCLPITRDSELVGILTLTDMHILLRMLLPTLSQVSPAKS